MTTGKSVMPSLDQDDEGNLQIYIPKRDFGDFIQGLLSQPRSIGKRWRRFFDVDQNFVRHLHELIRQRVQSQQIASLASFQASIFFLDGRVQTITSWEAFDSFNDNSDSVTTRLDIVWSYLVKFPSKPVPEKQTIAIAFNTGVRDVDTTTRNDLIGKFVRWFILDDEGSEIALRIEYTELTWGTDVLRHLEADLKNKIIVESWWVGAISNIISLIGLFIIPVMIAVPPALYFLLQDAQRVADKAEFMHTIALESDSQKSIILRLDYLIEDHRSNPLYDPRFWVYMATIVLVLASIALFVLRRPRSYLILNAAAQKHKVTSERRRRAFESSAAVTIVLGVISELVGAHLSDWINRLL